MSIIHAVDHCKNFPGRQTTPAQGGSLLGDCSCWTIVARRRLILSTFCTMKIFPRRTMPQPTCRRASPSRNPAHNPCSFSTAGRHGQPPFPYLQLGALLAPRARVITEEERRHPACQGACSQAWHHPHCGEILRQLMAASAPRSRLACGRRPPAGAEAATEHSRCGRWPRRGHRRRGGNHPASPAGQPAVPRPHPLAASRRRRPRSAPPGRHRAAPG